MKSLFVAILGAVFLILGAAAQTSSAQGRRVTVSVDASKTGAPISPYLYGQFIEHIGDVVNRFPGGNFLSNHDWQYAIGDPDKRPPTWDYVWSALQPNDLRI